MNGELLLLAGFVLVAAVAGYAVRAMSKATERAQAIASEQAEHTRQLSILLASRDAVTYQALRAADAFGSYDESSTSPEPEEDDRGPGIDDDGGAAELGGDPFVTGASAIFDPHDGRY